MTRQNKLSLRDSKNHLLRRRSAVLVMSGNELSEGDTRRVIDAYYQTFLLISDCVQLLKKELPYQQWHGFERKFSDKGRGGYLRAWAESDVAVIFKQLKNCLSALRHLDDKSRPTFGYDVFTINKCNIMLREYVKAYDVDTSGCVWQVIQPFFSLVWLNDTKENFVRLNDILQYSCRLTLKDVDWIEEENIQAYVEFERVLHEQEYPDDIVSELRQIVTHWFSHFDFSQVWADHGYGATAGVRRSAGTTAKYHDMVPTVDTARLASLIGWRPGDHVWPGIACRYRQLLRGERAYGSMNRVDMTCKVQLVPKGCDKKRVVSMEPTCHQFFQKQIGAAMKIHFQRHPEMHIELTNQEYNRGLAQRGSRNRDYATIDLSSASDSVTLTLVSKVFKDTPLFYPLMWCRTTQAELPDSRVIALEKFAPMGSAVCFPVECTIFSAIVALANKRCGVHTYWRVYGDDIVVSYLIYDQVIEILQALHFQVNLDKSFSPELPFKESCGIECYKGENVEPIRLSRKWDIVKMEDDFSKLRQLHLIEFDKNSKAYHLSRRKRADWSKTVGIGLQLEGLYKIGNALLERNYSSTRKHILSLAHKYYCEPVFSHNEEHGFLTTSLHLHHEGQSVPSLERYGLPNRREKSLSTSRLVSVIDIRSTIDDGSEIARYSKLLEEYDRSKRTSLLEPEDRIEVKAGAAHTRLQLVRVPLEDLLRYESSAELELMHSHILSDNLLQR